MSRQPPEERRVGPSPSRPRSPSPISRSITDPADREILPLLVGAPSTPTGPTPTSGARRSASPAPLLERVLPLIARSGRAFLRAAAASRRELVPLDVGRRAGVAFRLDIVHPARRRELLDRRRAGPRQRAAGDSRAVDGPAERLHLPRAVASRGSMPRGAFAWLSQLRGSGPVVIPPGATGQLVDVLARSGVDPSELPDELQFEIVARRRGPPSASAPTRERHRRRALPAAVTFDYGGLIVEPGSAPTSVFDSERRRLIRRDPGVRAGRPSTGSRRPGSGGTGTTFAATAGLRDRPAQLPHAVRDLVPQAGASKRKDARSARPSTMRSEVRSGIDWFELHGTVDFGDGLTARAAAPARGAPPGHARRSRSTTARRDGAGGVAAPLRRHRQRGRGGGGSRPLQGIAGGAARRGARRSSRRCASTNASRACATSWRRFSGIDAARRGEVVRRPAARLPARRARLVRVPAPLRVRRLPGRRHGARQDRHGAGVARSPPRHARSERARRSSSCRARSSSTGSRRRARFAPQLRVLDFSGADRSVEASRPATTSSLTTYGTLRRDALLLKDVEFEYAILDEAQAIKNANTAGGEGGAAAPRAAPAGAERHADREPPRRAVEPVRVPESGPARAPRPPSRGTAARRRGAIAGARRARARRPAVHPAPHQGAGRAGAAAAHRADACAARWQRRAARAVRGAARSLSHGAPRRGSQRDGHAAVEDARARGAAAAAPGGVPSRPGRRAAAPTAVGEVRRAAAAARRGARGRAQGAGLLAVHQPAGAAARAARRRPASPYEYLDGTTRDRQAPVNRFQDRSGSAGCS